MRVRMFAMSMAIIVRMVVRMMVVRVMIVRELLDINRLHIQLLIGQTDLTLIEPMCAALIRPHQVLCSQHLIRRAPRHHLMREQLGTLKIPLDLLKIMQHRDHRALLLLPTMYQTQQHLRGFRIHRIERLIEQNHRRILHQNPRK